MSEVKIEFRDKLTPTTCCKLIVHFIKYLLYEAEQIPLNYDSLNRILKKSQADLSVAHGDNAENNFVSYKQIKAYRFYKAIDSLLTICENTFKSLESEFIEPGKIEELVIIIGSTMIMPKKTIRIIIPSFSDHCGDTELPITRNLQSLCKNVITSEELHDYLRVKTGPSNIYFFLKMPLNHKPVTDYFLLNEDFRLPKIGKQISISFQQPEDKVLLADKGSCIPNVPNSSNDECVKNNICNWFQYKDSLKGLKGFNESGGASMFSVLKSIKGS